MINDLPLRFGHHLFIKIKIKKIKKTQLNLSPGVQMYEDGSTQVPTPALGD